MKNILIASLAVLLLTVGALPAFATSETSSDVPIVEEEQKEEEVLPEETEVLLKVPDAEGFVVKKLEHGVTVFLEADVAIRRAWSKSFTFDIDRDFENESSYATTGFWFGNGITSYWITYSRNVHTEDPGRASFSFSWAF